MINNLVKKSCMCQRMQSSRTSHMAGLESCTQDGMAVRLNTMQDEFI